MPSQRATWRRSSASGLAVLLAIMIFSAPARSQQSRPPRGQTTRPRTPAPATTPSRPAIRVIRPRPVTPKGGVLPPLTRKTRLASYEYALFGWQRMVTAAATAGFQQLTNRPPEWGQGLGGFTQRYADDWGRNAVQETIAYGFSSILDEDPRYRALHQGSIAQRMLWALKWTVLIRTQHGRAHPNFPLLVGSYATEFIANTWAAPSDNDPKAALRRGTYGLLGDFAFTVWKEFGPSWRPHVGFPKKKKKIPKPKQRTPVSRQFQIPSLPECASPTPSGCQVPLQ